MQDHPTPSEILGAVARFLKEVVVAETKGHTSFNARVAANALEMMRRQLDTAPAAEAAELRSLEAILGQTGDLHALNAELSRRLAEGELTLQTPGLAEHLWKTTLAKLAVDQPTYWGYRAALADRAGKAED
jgi:hypothetical protein